MIHTLPPIQTQRMALKTRLSTYRVAIAMMRVNQLLTRKKMPKQRARIREYAADNAELATGLSSVSRADARFEPEEFLQGAKAAYEMIVTAFAESNKRMLKDLLDRDVYEGFSSAIADRESRGEIVDQSFVGIERANIVEAELKGRSANVTVKFVSELISATHDRAGEIISGDPKRIKEVTDIWTFARDVSSRNPNWKLIATQAAN